MTTHSPGKRRYRYGRIGPDSDKGTLHVPKLHQKYGACEICRHVGPLVKSEATKGKYLGEECRWLIVDSDVNQRLSHQVKLSEANAEWSRWKRRKIRA